MYNRISNFSAGPAALPESVLEEARDDLLNYKNKGMSVMEMSHRGKDYDAIHNRAQENLKEILNIPDNYSILFLQGGGSHQFAMIPMNLCTNNGSADVILTGSWTKKCVEEINIVSKANIIASSEKDNFLKIPDISDLKYSSNADFVYLTSNNTIFGTQFKEFPQTKDIPLVVDMSSDILSKQININQFGIIFAGAQKNIGPSGVTVVIIRNDLIEKGRKDIPVIMQYRTHANKNSIYNTPPTFGIYLAGLVFEWIKKQGGLHIIQEKNEIKAKILYAAINNSDLYYCPVESKSRSNMNIVFRIKNNHVDLEEKFISEAKEAGIVSIKGHRSVGGLRASLYNAQPLENIKALIDFMETFTKKNT